jgi:hypothetical protein
MIRYEVVKPATFNDELKDKYSWKNVAERTEKVCVRKTSGGREYLLSKWFAW